MLAAQIRGACAAFDGNWSSVFGSVVVLGVCFVSLVMRLVPSLPCLLSGRISEQHGPGGHARLTTVSLQKDALEFSP